MQTTQPKFRLIRLDANNWAIERWQTGGEPISRGRYAGQLTQEKWDTVNRLYFPTLAWAAKRLLDLEIGETWPEDGWTGADIRTAIDAAESRVLEAVAATCTAT